MKKEKEEKKEIRIDAINILIEKLGLNNDESKKKMIIIIMMKKIKMVDSK